MNNNCLTLTEVKDMVLFVSKGMIASKELLTHADQAIGDGDHGIGIARGFEAVEAKIQTSTFNNVDEIFRSVGMTLLSTIGGAAGAIFGSFFLGAASGLLGATTLDSKSACNAFTSGLEQVKKRGGAKAGDKTMIDALEPAIMVAKQSVASPLIDFFALLSGASEKGMESTKNMIATTGKAKTLGERSLGFPDPGSITMSLLFKYMHEYLVNLKVEEGK